MKNFWEVIENNTLYNRGIVKFKEELCYHQKKEVHHSFFHMEFLDWVNIVAITPKKKVLLVKQYRFGTGEITLEIPGGTLDQGESNPKAAAKRELMEETGYSSDKLIFIGKVAVNPAIQDNYCHFYLAKDVKLIGDQNLDPAEDIEIDLVHLKEIEGMIKQGMIKHSLAVLGLLYAKEHLK